MSINQESSSFIKDIELIDKYDGKTQWRWIYEVIDIIFLSLIISPQNLSNSVDRMKIFLSFYLKIIIMLLNKLLSKTDYINRLWWSDVPFLRPRSQRNIWPNTKKKSWECCEFSKWIWQQQGLWFCQIQRQEVSYWSKWRYLKNKSRRIWTHVSFSRTVLNITILV